MPSAHTNVDVFISLNSATCELCHYRLPPLISRPAMIWLAMLRLL